MKFINSSSVENINGKDCLHIFLKEEYSYPVKINDEEVLQNEIFIKAPTMSNEDVSNVRRCSSVFSKFEDIQNEKISKELSRLSQEDKERLFYEIENIKESEDESGPEEAIKNHVISVLKSAKSFESQDSNYYTEFDKISLFLNKRLNRCMDDEFYSIDFSIFDKHLALKQFIIEEIFIEYISFFFKHFPLESLLNMSQKQ